MTRTPRHCRKSGRTEDRYQFGGYRSPFRAIARPVIDYVRRLRRDMPRSVVRVYIPEYVVGHCWENLLHNQSALRLKRRLLFEYGKHEAPCPEPRETVS